MSRHTMPVVIATCLASVVAFFAAGYALAAWAFDRLTKESSS